MSVSMYAVVCMSMGASIHKLLHRNNTFRSRSKTFIDTLVAASVAVCMQICYPVPLSALVRKKIPIIVLQHVKTKLCVCVCVCVCACVFVCAYVCVCMHMMCCDVKWL
jgi:hypothetical protein